MNKFLSILLFSLFVLTSTAIAQNNFYKKKEAGVFIGTSYYLGDINPTRQFYSPRPSFGGLFKYYLNDRHCLRVHGFYGQFSARDADFQNEFQQARNGHLSASLLDINAVYEFNFLPFKYNDRKRVFSPYLFGGFGYEFKLTGQTDIGNHFAIPFGTGIKYMASRKVTLGAEWSFRKTFKDNIDGIVDPGKPADKSIISNNDWYSFAGFFITFRLFDNSGNCPVYPQKQ